MIRTPKPQTEFRRLGDRLALFHAQDTQDRYWSDYWRDFDFDSLETSEGFASLGELGPIFEKHVHPGDRVLEAGCGAGRIMAACVSENFEVLGIEFSEDVVSAVRERASFLDVQQGDVEKLDLPDKSFDVYVSLGVVEHHFGGPELALEEAWRVLRRQGCILISVPFLIPLRARCLSNLSGRNKDSSLSFHQYYFSQDQLGQALAATGFEVVDHLPYDVEAFLLGEHPLFSRFWVSALCRERVRSAFRQRFPQARPAIRSRFGHMLLAIGMNQV